MLKLKRTQLFLIFNLFFIIGIIAGFLVRAPAFYLYIVFLALIIGLVIFYNKYLIRIILLGCCFLVLGLWRFNINPPKIDESKISFYNDSQTEFIGVVADEPDVRIDHTKLKVESNKVIEYEGQPQTAASRKVKGKVLISTKLFPEFNYGDKLQIKCNLQAPRNFNGFAYDKYLARYDIYSVCYYPEIILLSSGNGSKFYAGIYKFKNRLKTIISQSLPEPQSSLLSAIILGAKRGIPRNLSEKFSQIGISHIVAISGMHISILAMLLLYLGVMIGLHRNQAFYFATVALFLYILLIGFPASAVRAGVMGFLVLLAMRLGRLNKATNAIVFAAALMLLINPLLIYDISFQLSFLAVLGLIYVLPVLEEMMDRLAKVGSSEQQPPNPAILRDHVTIVVSPLIRGARGVCRAITKGSNGNLGRILKPIFTLILVTISAQITTLPAILYHFSRLSIIAPIANVLIVPLLPLVMILGLALLISALVWIGLAQAIGWIVWLVLSYLILVVNFLSRFGFSFIDVKISWWMVAVAYGVIGGLIVKSRKSVKSLRSKVIIF
jgi:competence protein ComEC